MYEVATTSVRAPGGVTKDFPIRMSLHQASALTLYLFNLVLNVLTTDIQKILHNCMMFANDIVLIEESREEVNSQSEIW